MKTKLLAACFALLLCASAAWASETRYYVPPAQFNAALQIMDQGFANVFGLFKNATAGFAFDPETKTISRLKVALDASSLEIPNRDAALDLTKLLDPATYPEIAFVANAPASFKDGKAEIKGTLTIHGQSKPASLEGTLNSVGKNKHSGSDDDAVGLSLRGSFKRADFAMGDEPEIPGRFGDTVSLMLEMQAIQP